MLSLKIRKGARYLIRFDDICPTTNWELWDQIEKVLCSYDVRPILAVIPDNQDPELRHGVEDPRFWERVRHWQAKNWTIGLHGYQHRYVTKSPGIVGLNRYSEFAGLSYEEQKSKLEAALAIFQHNAVTPDLWVAPAHTFDRKTVKALLELGVSTISDGFHIWPFVDADEILWIPQQLGDFHSMPLGIWTVCIHIDDPAHADAAVFQRQIERFRKNIIDVPTVQKSYLDNRQTSINNAVGKIVRWSKLLNCRREELFE